MIVNDYLKARAMDFLPSTDTEKILAMGGGKPGRQLYGAFKTLDLQGRFSRTQIEQALTYSPTAYPEYIQLWISSLEPRQRSMYAANLYNSKFAGIQWDTQFYDIIDKQLRGEGLYQRIQPAMPLGDDRHSPKMASISRIASEFYDLLYVCVLSWSCSTVAQAM